MFQLKIIYDNLILYLKEISKLQYCIYLTPSFTVFKISVQIHLSSLNT